MSFPEQSRCLGQTAAACLCVQSLWAGCHGAPKSRPTVGRPRLHEVESVEVAVGLNSANVSPGANPE